VEARPFSAVVCDGGSGQDSESGPEGVLILEEFHVANRPDEGFLEEVVEGFRFAAPAGRKIRAKSAMILIEELLP
jgi:hypothetical protein